MMAAKDQPALVPCLVQLFDEFDELRPKRDRRTDGAEGNLAHRLTSSDHNRDDTPGTRTPFTDDDRRPEVHAADVDDDLDDDDPELMHRVIQTVLLPRLRAGVETRLQNIIHRRKIYSRSTGWDEETYWGSNPHTEHAHFSARYTAAAEKSTKPYGLAAVDRESEWDMDAAGRKALAEAFADALANMPVKVGEETWKFSTALGYLTRKAYEIDKTLDAAADELAQHVADVDAAAITPTANTAVKPAKAAPKPAPPK